MSNNSRARIRKKGKGEEGKDSPGFLDHIHNIKGYYRRRGKVSEELSVDFCKYEFVQTNINKTF